METNEIKSFRLPINLEKYLEVEDLKIKESFNILNIRFDIFENPIKVYIPNYKGYCLGKVIINDTLHILICTENYNSIYISKIDEYYTNIEVVSKSSIKNLKYVEQKKLFENGEENNG